MGVDAEGPRAQRWRCVLDLAGWRSVDCGMFVGSPWVLGYDKTPTPKGRSRLSGVPGVHAAMCLRGCCCGQDGDEVVQTRIRGDARPIMRNSMSCYFVIPFLQYTIHVSLARL